MNILACRILHVKAAIYTTILSETKEVSTSKEVAPFFYNFHSIFYTGLGVLLTKNEKYGDSEKLVSDNGKVGQKGC